jgi:ABC-2 type transport system permease protein
MSAGPVSLEGLGRPIKGPTALGSDPRRFWHLTLALAVTDFKLRYFGSALGYLWQLMRPLMLFGVLLVVFTKIATFGGDAPYYPQGLLLGIVLYVFVSESTGGAVTSLIDRENLVRKIEFPRLAVPLATVLVGLFNLALNLIAVLVFILAAGVAPRWSWLELPFLLGAVAILATGMSMLLSALYVRYRDVRPIWEVVLQMFFYGSPIFYMYETVVAKAGPGLAHALIYNPFAAILQQARHALLGPGHATAAEAIGGGARLLAPLLLTLAILALGLRVFSRAAPRIAEEL